MPGTSPIRTHRRGPLLNVVALMLLGMGAVASFAQDPPAGERHCRDFNASWTEFEVDPIEDGEHTDGTLTVTIDFDEGDRTFDWTSNVGVDAVFVKGSEDAGSLYTYDPEATSDTGLHAPLKETTPEEGDFYSINHVLFCYDGDVAPTESPTPTPTPTDTETPGPTVSPTESETPGPTVSPTETETPGTTVSPTTVQTPPRVLGTKALGNTGADVRSLALMGLLMIGLSVLAYAVAARAAKSKAR